MKTIEERAIEYADRHKATEINYFGVGKVYGYERIYNAEITAYERGATEQKAIDEEVRLKKCDDMTKAEYDREVAFADWYHKMERVHQHSLMPLSGQGKRRLARFVIGWQQVM